MTKTIRLIYPQWQGANIRRLLPEFSEADASTGYVLGANLLNFLSPETKNKIVSVPVSADIDRKEKNGILYYAPLSHVIRGQFHLLNRQRVGIHHKEYKVILKEYGQHTIKGALKNSERPSIIDRMDLIGTRSSKKNCYLDYCFTLRTNHATKVIHTPLLDYVQEKKEQHCQSFREQG